MVLRLCLLPGVDLWFGAGGQRWRMRLGRASCALGAPSVLEDEFRQREYWRLMVFRRLGVLLDDLFNQLADVGLQPNFAALHADECRDIFKFAELFAPLLPVGDVPWLQISSALSTSIGCMVIPSFGSKDRVHRVGSYRWTVMM
jgi:hypothetical protein